jgi:ABC-type nitrate/sulfonate/bicarbonate transport system permease component
MAATDTVRSAPARRHRLDQVTLLRLAIVVVVFAAWELLAQSGWLYQDVVPSLTAIAKALAILLTNPDFYFHLGVSLGEIASGVVIGGGLGLIVGLVLGANRLLADAYEAFLYYLGPTPKIIFLPIMIMWFGVGSGSKVAMGALSCFFPVALSAAAGLRGIDPVLIRVGRSFRANTWQTATKIYLPAIRLPLINGMRLGFGVAFIGTLLAETRLSNRGIGFLITNAYSVFDMPRMYAILIVLFALGIGVNALLGLLASPDRTSATARS